jgi:hypothetical protein
MSVKPYFEENKEKEVSVKVAPIEDILIMKLMTERIRDHFDVIAIILGIFEKLSVERFWANSKQSNRATRKEKVEFFFGRHEKRFSKETLERIHWKRVHKRTRSYAKRKDKQAA